MPPSKFRDFLNCNVKTVPLQYHLVFSGHDIFFVCLSKHSEATYFRDFGLVR